MTRIRLAPDDGKAINLNWRDRFVATDILRDAYVRYEESLNPSAPPFVTLDDGLELGIVHSDVPAIARAISSMLTCSLEDAKNENGGHLPSAVVERVQLEIISPWGVANLWGQTGHRFVLSRSGGGGRSEILATILVGQSRQTIFFLTGRYNNLRHSTVEEEVDFDQPAGDDPDQRWFDLFAFPEIERFKPWGYHHIANFVVAKGHRGERLSRRLLEGIIERYAKDHLDANERPIEHGQHLLCGRGFWQIGDPPWLTRMERLGFYLRWGAESFFIEKPWAPLPAVFDGDRKIGNLEYNRSFGLPERYQGPRPTVASDEHLLERLPEVIALSEDPNAKLQYFQTMFDFC